MRAGLRFGVLMLALAGCGERNVVVADREGDAGGVGSDNEGGSGNGGAGAGGLAAGGGSGGEGGSTQSGGTGAETTGGNAGAAQGGDGNAAGAAPESGGSSGDAGTSAGRGGSEGGRAGEAGSGASGGSADRDCETIVAEYGEVLRDATACNPLSSVEQCTLLVPANTGCDCETFANPANADALQRLEDLADEVSVCERPCPTTCWPTERGVCGSGTADYGICYGVD